MGLLDDLEQEAQKIREGSEEALKRKREFFDAATIPAMENLYAYLQRLAKSLNFLKNERLARYKVPGYGDVVCRIGNDMNVQAQMPMYAREIKVTVSGLIDQSACPLIKIEGASRVEAMLEAFRRCGFEGMQKAEKDERGAYLSARFQAAGKIQMLATFSADMHSDMLKMEFTNFDALVSRKQAVPVTAITEEMLDSVGKYLAHQQNYVMRETVSEEHREALRAKVQQENQRREWEQKIAAVQIAEEEKLRNAKAGRITGRLKAITDEMLPGKTKTAASTNGGILSKLSGLFSKKDK